MRLWPMWALPLAILASAAVFAQSDVVVTKRTTELRASAGPSAPVVANLAVDTTLKRLPNRQSAWVEVRTPNGDTGWVHMFDIGAPNAPTAPSNTATGVLRGLGNFFARGSQASKTTTATSTIGIRGLGAEDIAQAQPNLAAVDLVESFRQSPAQAQQFAAYASLTPRQVQPLPLPAAPQPQTQDNAHIR